MRNFALHFLVGNNTMLIKCSILQAGLVNLQILSLSNNKITYIDKDAFAGLKIMFELDLKNNMIEKLHPHTFTGKYKN